MAQVIIGVDPHKLSATIEVVDRPRDSCSASGRFSTDQAGYAAMRELRRRRGRSGSGRSRAANGAGRPLAQRLLEAGEQVVDVPAKLAARVRLFDTGHNRKTDAHDAHSIAVVAVRTKGLRVLQLDGELEALRMLADRREELTRRRVQTVNRLQALLAELLPGQAQEGHHRRCRPRRCWPSVRPRDIAGKTRRRHRRRGARRAGRGRGEDQEGHRRAQGHGPGPRLTPDGPATASAPSSPPGSWPTSATSPGSPTATGSRPGPAPHPWTPPPASRTGTGSPGPGTGG